MEETSGEECFPPMKKGAYNLDFLDDNACFNPFESKCKLGESPPSESSFDENINPFQTKTKLGHSPPQNPADDNFNPFKTDSKLRHSPEPVNNLNYEEKNGNQIDDMDNLSFDQERYIEDEELDDFSDPMFDYGSENTPIIDKNISIVTADKDQCGAALNHSDREQSYDSLEENVTQDEFIDNDFAFTGNRDSMTHPADAYDDFKDAESYDNISRNDDLTETDRQLKKEMVHKVKPLDLKKHFDELEELVSLEVRKDSQELVEEPINNINNNNLKGSESDQEESFPYSDAAADQIEDSEIPSFDQVSEAHPLPIPNLTTENSDEQEKLSPDFDDGILQENLVPTKEDIYKKEQNEFSSLDVLGREEHKSEPIDDLSSSTVLNSPNLCEDSGLGDSIVTSGSEDLDKADDMKSEEGMESLPATPDALSDQNLTLSQKNDAGFEDDEDFQPDELLPEMSQAQLADNGEEFFSENISENMCTALENGKLNTAHDLDLIAGIDPKSKSLVDEPETECLKGLPCRESCEEFKEIGESLFSDEQQGEIEKSIDNNSQSAFGESTVFEKDLGEIQTENIIDNIQNDEEVLEESVLPLCIPGKQIDTEGEIEEFNLPLSISNTEESVAAKEHDELEDNLDSINDSAALDDCNFSPAIEEILDLPMENVPGEAIDDVETYNSSMTTLTTKFNDESDFDKVEAILGLDTADDLEHKSVEDSKDRLKAISCEDHPDDVCSETNIEHSSELNKDYGLLSGLDNEKLPENKSEDFSHAFKMSENEINNITNAGESFGDEFKLEEFKTDELFDTMSKHESLSENEIQYISKIFNQDSDTSDPNTAAVATDIGNTIENKMGLKFNKSSEENISLNDLSPNKSLESIDKLFAKSRNNVPEKVPSAESSQMSVIGALVVGSQLIASAVLGPSAVCPPALKSPYFNSPLHETQQLMGKPPSPQAFPPAASCVSPGNKQINAETESTEDGAILHPLTTMSEESDSQPSSEALVLDLQSKEFAVENGTVSSQSKDCVTAPQMRVTSISAEANMLEDG